MTPATGFTASCGILIITRGRKIITKGRKTKRMTGAVKILSTRSRSQNLRADSHSGDCRCSPLRDGRPWAEAGEESANGELLEFRGTPRGRIAHLCPSVKSEHKCIPESQIVMSRWPIGGSHSYLIFTLVGSRASAILRRFRLSVSPRFLWEAVSLPPLHSRWVEVMAKLPHNGSRRFPRQE
jgi:hypothetical protein